MAKAIDTWKVHPTIPQKRTNLPRGRLEASIYFGVNEDNDAPHLAIILTLRRPDAPRVMELVFHRDPPSFKDATTVVSLRDLAGWVGDEETILGSVGHLLSLAASSRWVDEATLRVDVVGDESFGADEVDYVNVKLAIGDWVDDTFMTRAQWEWLTELV